MYGETTRQFLSFLRERGPQTAKQLSEQKFWGGVRTRVQVLIKQGRVEKVLVANPDENPGPYSRAVCTAFKLVQSAVYGPIKGRPDGKKYKEKRKAEREEKAVARAIAFLEQRGYKVATPNVQDHRPCAPLAQGPRGSQS